MGVEHVNRMGQTYYLHEGKTKTGKPTYFFSMKKDGVLVEAIPAGYEIYEKPSAQVFLRKIPPRVVTAEEVAVVERGVRQLANLNNYIIDVEKNGIIVFLPDQNWDEIATLLGGQFGLPARLPAGLERRGSYSPMMRFVLADKERRTFRAERWCFRGSIDGWWPLSPPSDLAPLVARYTPHLGKESFFELM
jgi:hypothetical protein